MYRRARAGRAAGRAARACGLAIESSSSGDLADPRAQLLDHAVLGDADLGHRIAVAERDGAVLHGLVVDGDAEGRADLVLATIPLADRPRLIVVHRELPPERVVDAPGALRLAVLAEQWEDSRLVRGELRMQAQHDARLALHLVLVVRVEEKGQGRAVGSGRRLDDVRHEALPAFVVEVAEVLAAVLGVAAEVEVGAVGDAL